MKIIIIGCPGAGKSVLTKRLNTILNYPVMHLDKIYHTGGKSHITREELVNEVNRFTNKYENWIIDGNYISILEMRVKLADTIILLNIPSDICLKNVYEKEKECIKNGVNRDDMAGNFDVTVNEEFIIFIKNFGKETLTKIKNILGLYGEKNIIIVNSYSELDKFIDNFKLYDVI